jgi:hypothetical protein
MLAKSQIRLVGKSKPDIFIVFPREIMLLLLALHAICSTQRHSNMLDRHHAVFIAGFTRNLQYAEPLRHAE